MDVRVWGELEGRLIEIRARRGRAGAGLLIEGLPSRHGQTTADRVRAALINAGIVPEAPDAVVRLEPRIAAGSTGLLDLAIVLAALASAGVVGSGLRWILATGRVSPDGRVRGAVEAGEPVWLQDILAVLCRTLRSTSEPILGGSDPGPDTSRDELPP